jgi:rhamnosyltransferase
MTGEGREPAVSVIILTKNGGPEFARCLDGVFAQETVWPYEVLVVDSGSTDGTLEVARRYPTRLMQIRPQEFNHGTTRNLGAAQSRGRYVAFLTQDAVPADAYWLSPLVAALQDASVAGAFSRQLPKADCNVLARRALERWAAGGTERVVKALPGPAQYAALSPWERFWLAAFDDVSSCLRKDVWQRFSFAQVSFGEDIEWARRVLEAGYRLVYEPASRVYHSHNRSVAYEFQRTYVDHQHLHRLFGLRLIPTLGSALSCVTRGSGDYWRYVLQSQASWGEKVRLLALVPFLTPAQVFGQYLGAHSDELMSRYPWFTRLDQALRRGI